MSPATLKRHLLTDAHLSNAMALMFTFTVGYAIVGTHLFRERSPEYFGNLAASLFTLCQVITDITVQLYNLSLTPASYALA